MNRRGFIRALAATATVAPAAAVAVQVHNVGSAPIGLNPWPGAQERFIFGGQRGGKSRFADMMLAEWMRSGQVGSQFFLARHGTNMSQTFRKTSETTFEMSLSTL